MEKVFIKYLGSLEAFLNNHKEFDENYNEKRETLEYYQLFLKETDYIANKLIEAQVMGVECKDYSLELEARQYAREQINNLQA